MQDNKIKVAVYFRFGIDPEPKTALYCRTATKTSLLDSNGIEAQKSRLLRFAEENGYDNPVLYMDNGASGLNLNRPAMNRLTDDIKSGKVKTVIVTSIDRVARGSIPFMEWLSDLKGTGCRCLSLETRGQDVRAGFTFLRD